ncbi:flagellar hook-associated protein FlgK [candidate division KSB1 bacterium]|nr:MAG: flagellar hook-associated protein FlgK [candidate division KSB1 bacterium]
MSSLADILNTGRNALRVQQLAMQVVGQNTSNADTEGYTRRRLELCTAPPYDSLGRWDAGAGVDIQHLGRIRDQLIDEQYRRESSQLGYWSQRDDVLGRVEEIFSELGGSAISDQLQDFWAAWSELSNQPEGQAARLSLVETAQTLTTGVRRVYDELASRFGTVDKQMVDDVTEVNAITSHIAQLNVQIVRAETDGLEASDLRDARDSALDRLSQLINITTQENGDGAVNVYNGGQILVQVDRHTEISISAESHNGRVSSVFNYGSSGRKLTLEGGEIKALMDIRDQDIGRVMDDMDEFAVNLAHRVNDIHTQGYGLTNTNGIEFFAADVTGASSLRLSSLITDDPSRIATASAANAPGDNSIALQIAGIQNEKLMNNGRSTLDDYYRDIVLQVGSRKSYATGQLKVEQAAMNHLENRRQSVSGVSLDEEMTRLIQVQQAYDAAARIVNTVDEMMQTVLTLGAS